MTEVEKRLADRVVEAFEGFESVLAEQRVAWDMLKEAKRQFLAEATSPVKYRRIFYRGYVLRVVDEVLAAHTGASPHPIDLVIERCEDGQ